MRARCSMLFVFACVALGGCRDPVKSARQEALGPEQAGVPRGPLHRPGQPCTVCHSPGGGAPNFSLAGTVFANAAGTLPLAGVVVQVLEHNGNQKYFTTNAAGSFYVSASDWSPDFPLWASIGYTCADPLGSYVHVEMRSQIFRASGCADCHFDPRGPSSAGHVYLNELAEGRCP